MVRKKKSKQPKKQTKFIGAKSVGFSRIDVDYSADVSTEKGKIIKDTLEKVLNDVQAKIDKIRSEYFIPENHSWHTYTVKRERIGQGEPVTDKQIIRNFEELFKDKPKETNLGMALGGFCWSNSENLHYTVPAFEEYQYLKVVEEIDGKKHHRHIRNYGSPTERGSYANSPDYWEWVESFAARNAIKDLEKIADSLAELLLYC